MRCISELTKGRFFSSLTLLPIVGLPNRITLSSLNCTTGFEILAFPCNQFLGQEPTTSQEVQKFACDRYKVEFPIFQKVCVNGQETAPLYKYLKARKTGFFGSRIKWNFTKFLIDKEGRVISRYGTTTPPLAIEILLGVGHCVCKWLI
ncbi:probable glutathione peroxidase 5 isoform X5 [Syzygium oleosum]|uniref:probable glutathione peroxidase 5 isoform X5 n=1 Tax=Syzygium oleosum TaxID=219896 RepID=UPI0024B92202|nr:probable glutathione peroxidase 5 isoform X5 [Syzygium oleosum]